MLIDSIDVPTSAGLRDRALIGLMVYSFARVGAALAMKVEDVYVRYEMPCHPQSRGLPSRIFRRLRPRERPEGLAVSHDRARHRTRRRALAARIMNNIGNHFFRATGITASLKNGGTLEKSAGMANHASTRTTQLYDRRRDGPR